MKKIGNHLLRILLVTLLFSVFIPSAYASQYIYLDDYATMTVPDSFYLSDTNYLSQGRVRLTFKDTNSNILLISSQLTSASYSQLYSAMQSQYGQVSSLTINGHDIIIAAKKYPKYAEIHAGFISNPYPILASFTVYNNSEQTIATNAIASIMIHDSDEDEDSVVINGVIYTLDEEDDDYAIASGVTDRNISTITLPVQVKINGEYRYVCEVAEGAFKGLPNLKIVNLSSYTSIIEDNAFQNCKKLKSINGKKSTDLWIGTNAFSGCSSLTTASFGQICYIQAKAFSGCKKLKKITGLNGIETIGKSAFNKCSSLTSFTLGKKVSEIGAKAFYGCSKLKKISIKSPQLTNKNVGAGAFKNINPQAIFTCPPKKIDEYKTLFLKKGAPKTAKFK